MNNRERRNKSGKFIIQLYITWQCVNSYIQYFVEMYIYKLVFNLFIGIVI